VGDDRAVPARLPRAAAGPDPRCPQGRGRRAGRHAGLAGVRRRRLRDRSDGRRRRRDDDHLTVIADPTFTQDRRRTWASMTPAVRWLLVLVVAVLVLTPSAVVHLLPA